MNRKERRRLKKQGVQVPKDPAISIKLSDLGSRIMTPEKTAAMNHEINRQILEADKRLSLDLDSVVLWTLYQDYGWREKRLYDFYLRMGQVHKQMRECYESDVLFAERFKLKEAGVDLEAWQKEFLEMYD